MFFFRELRRDRACFTSDDCVFVRFNMFGVTLAADAINVPAGRQQRGPNKRRKPYSNDEDIKFVSRLRNIQINQNNHKWAWSR
jgi:hypothetical protein